MPLVIDSTGKVVGRVGRLGGGPGEFSENPGPFRVGTGDSLFIRNQVSLSVFSPSLKFIRSVPFDQLQMGDFLPQARGFVIGAPRRVGKDSIFTLHLTNAAGKVVRSFRATGIDSAAGSWFGRTLLTPGTNAAVWVAPYLQHHFERWTSAGARTVVIDTQPNWYVFIPATRPGNRSVVRSFREVSSLLWVMSAVPVPAADSIIRAATGRRDRSPGTDDGGRPRYPLELITTTMLEAYDAVSGKLVAELHVPAYGVAFLDDSHFAMYSTSSDDLPQLEVWQFGLKR